MNKNEQKILSGTFTNLYVTNKKSNIASIVHEMDKEEMDNIKLITSSPKSEYIKNRIRKKLKTKNSILNEEYLLDKKKSFPLIKNRRESNKIISSKSIFSDNNINNNNNKQKYKSPINIKKHYLLNKRMLKIEQCFSEKKDKKKYTIDINDKKENEKIINTNPINRNKKILNLLKLKKNVRFKTLDANNMFNIKSKKINNFITESNNKINTDKYYQTNKHFSEKKLFSNKKLINNNRKTSLLDKTKALNFIKSLPRLKLSEAHLSEIEDEIYTIYENNKFDLKEKDKEIKEFKKKCQTIFEKFEESATYDIAV